MTPSTEREEGALNCWQWGRGKPWWPQPSPKVLQSRTGPISLKLCSGLFHQAEHPSQSTAVAQWMSDVQHHLLLLVYISAFSCFRVSFGGPLPHPEPKTPSEDDSEVLGQMMKEGSQHAGNLGRCMLAGRGETSFAPSTPPYLTFSGCWGKKWPHLRPGTWIVLFCTSDHSSLLSSLTLFLLAIKRSQGNCFF